MEFPEGRGVYPGSRFWKIQRGGGVIRKIPSVRGVWIFSGTTHCELNMCYLCLFFSSIKGVGSCNFW